MPQSVPVLLMARRLAVGGAERDLAKLAIGLDRQVFDPHVACFEAGGMRAQEIAAARIPVVSLGVASFRSLSGLRGALNLGRYILRHGIQVVHTFDLPTTMFAAPVAKLSGANVLLTSQLGFRSLETRAELGARWLSDRLSNAVHVNSRAVAGELLARGAVDEEKLFLCHNGVDEKEFHRLEATSSPRFEDAKVVIGAVCAMRPEKDLATLISAFAAAGLHKAGARLLLVGSGSMKPAWQNLATRLGLKDVCRFEPTTADVVRCYSDIDIYVQSSTTESFSNSLLEAMSCGCAVIASRVGGTEEMVSDGDSGLLFTAGNVDELGQKLSLLMSDASLRRRLAARAAVVARDEFSLDEYVRRCSQKYLSLLQ